MSQGKKKIKNKKRYAFGGLQEYSTPQGQGFSDQQIDQTGQGVASAINPLWGALAKIGTSASQQVRGSGLSATSNFAADTLDPFHQFKSLKNGSNTEKFMAFANPLLGSWMAAKRQKKDRQEQLLRQDPNQVIALMQNSNTPAMKNGGRILAKSLNPLAGGDLEAISDDAVVVKANDPSKEDSVELDSAFVDHDEVIDNKNRVFSDALKTTSGKTIAKEAKRLEKMKNKHYESRFSDANSHIDKKLDELFTYQENMKKEYNFGGKYKYKSGGRLDEPKPPKKLSLADWKNGAPERDFNKHPLTVEEIKGWTQEIKTRQADRTRKLINKYPKPGLEKGGPFSEADLAGTGSLQGSTPIVLDNSMQPATAWWNYDSSTTPMAPQATKGGFDWRSALSTAATVAPNIAGAFLQNRLRGPVAPSMETDTRLNRISAAPQLAEASRAYNQARQVITQNTGQSANLTSAVGNILAKRLSAQNQIYGEVNNLNTQISNQEAGMNQAIRARNIERMNQFRSNQVDFSNRKLQMTSENIANLSGKVLQRGRERNQQERDRQAYEFLQSAYGDSGVLSRLAEANPELFASLNKSLGKKSNKMGGKIGKLYKGSC